MKRKNTGGLEDRQTTTAVSRQVQMYLRILFCFIKQHFVKLFSAKEDYTVVVIFHIHHFLFLHIS